MEPGERIIYHAISDTDLQNMLHAAREEGKLQALASCKRIRIAELTELAQVSRRTLRDWEQKGILPPQLVIGGWNFNRIYDLMNLSDYEYRKKYRL